jgi:RNA polymerase sigma-70 factor (ECF subfamily)
MTVINGIKEETLIQRLINGEQTAFELLFRFYYPGLVTFASRIVLDTDEAEEIVQDFFVKLWTGRKEIKYSISFTRENREVELSGEAFLDVAKNEQSSFV